jgi:hypothetical protein
MPVSTGDLSRLTMRNYPSGHMVYLDNTSRTAMKTDVALFFASASAPAALAKKRLTKDTEVVSQSRYRRRFSRTPY